ncbi:uncharacterized protein I303_107213 [Kwoniella dejecticola CBS 10117]|uniref:Uncharacterized protein n=1 Tax=Kwoniella dejecticola CBS 10117 TaxID=1296121 RepID=A0A1A5ZZ42_9TREE|nr:uncharacterized protein I303_06614 [Kwoniella dejecticola CBS 10117]OBR83055.1 hypothetical protein I303_06614 [Kwoniella dejecticola CBS 10117]
MDSSDRNTSNGSDGYSHQQSMSIVELAEMIRGLKAEQTQITNDLTTVHGSFVSALNAAADPSATSNERNSFPRIFGCAITRYSDLLPRRRDNYRRFYRMNSETKRFTNSSGWDITERYTNGIPAIQEERQQLWQKRSQEADGEIAKLEELVEQIRINDGCATADDRDSFLQGLKNIEWLDVSKAYHQRKFEEYTG